MGIGEGRIIGRVVCMCARVCVCVCRRAPRDGECQLGGPCTSWATGDEGLKHRSTAAQPLKVGIGVGMPGVHPGSLLAC